MANRVDHKDWLRTTIDPKATAMAPPVWTNPQIINQLDSGFHWAGQALTFGFPTAAPRTGGEAPGFSALNSTQQSYATLAIKLWDDLIAPDFSFEPNGQNATLKYANTTTGIGYAHAYYPENDLAAGSIWFNSTYGAASGTNNLVSPTVGKWGFLTYIHETGHALGLDHPGDYNGGIPTYSKDALYAQDSLMYTAMSYFNAVNTGADWIASDGNEYDAQTPMLHDIMAIQAMYGAETNTRVGETTYGFNSNADVWIYNFNQNAHPILCIYDSAGSDTLDLSGWNYSCTISLEPGTFSHADQMTYNISIAFNTMIENGIGGGGNDVIYGNVANNFLSGGLGNDLIWGGIGNDNLEGGVGLDTALFAGGSGLYTTTAISPASVQVVRASETDALFNIERLQFSDAIIAFDIQGNAGQVYRLYEAAFDRTPDVDGLSSNVHLLDTQLSLAQMSGAFAGSQEFNELYGATDNAGFVTTLFRNVLEREPDAGGHAHWTGLLNAGQLTRGDVLISFSESQENHNSVDPMIANGIRLDIDYFI